MFQLPKPRYTGLAFIAIAAGLPVTANASEAFAKEAEVFRHHL